MAKTALILGFDPGLARTGFGLIESRPSLRLVESGLLGTPAGGQPEERLAELSAQATALLKRTKPDAVAIERLFFSANVKTAMQVAEARGVLMAAAAKVRLPVTEYTPQEIKQSVTAHGAADKHQVAEMVVRLLKLQAAPKPDDVTDAIAIALCHEQWAKYKKATD